MSCSESSGEMNNIKKARMSHIPEDIIQTIQQERREDLKVFTAAIEKLTLQFEYFKQSMDNHNTQLQQTIQNQQKIIENQSITINSLEKQISHLQKSISRNDPFLIKPDELQKLSEEELRNLDSKRFHIIRNIEYEISRKSNFLIKNVNTSNDPHQVANAIAKKAGDNSLTIKSAIFIGKPKGNMRLVKVTTSKPLTKDFFLNFKSKKVNTELNDLVIFQDKSPIQRELARRRWDQLNKDQPNGHPKSFRKI